MLNSLLSTFFNNKSSDDTLKLTKPGVKEAVYRDELSKKQISNQNISYFERSEPLLRKREVKEDGKGVAVMRVKVKMTKKEAARMLSRCKDGGVLDFKDVANELKKIPISRVTLEQSPACTRTAAGPVLKSIAEE